MAAPLNTRHRQSARAGDALAGNSERALWSTFQLAVDVDLAECTPESHTLRTLAHHAWRAAFLAEGVAI